MQMFPGRTLEEIDQTDYFRLQRALAARSIERIEERREAYADGDKTTKLTPDEWTRIREHDRLVENDDEPSDVRSGH